MSGPGRPVPAGAVRRAPGVPRPAHALARISVGLLVVIGWSAIGHQSGSGWVVALGGLVAATLAVGLVGPLIAISTARLVALGAPADAQAGTAFVVEFAASRRVRVRPVTLGGEPSCAGPDGVLNLELLAARRGVLETVVLQVETAAPFGLLWWSRHVRVELPRPVHVAPRRGKPLGDVLERVRSASAGFSAARSSAGDLRSVREYRHGDSPRRVHWPATAHGTTLMVRETDEPLGATAVVAADLPHDPDAAEARAERVLGTVVELLTTGSAVRLETVEAVAGRVSTLVPDIRTAGRRLARAVPA